MATWFPIGMLLFVSLILISVFASMNIRHIGSAWAWIWGSLGVLAAFTAGSYAVHNTWIYSLIGAIVHAHWILQVIAALASFALLAALLLALVPSPVSSTVSLTLAVGAGAFFLPMLIVQADPPGTWGQWSVSTVDQVGQAAKGVTAGWFR